MNIGKRDRAAVWFRCRYSPSFPADFVRLCTDDLREREFAYFLVRAPRSARVTNYGNFRFRATIFTTDSSNEILHVVHRVARVYPASRSKYHYSPRFRARPGVHGALQNGNHRASFEDTVTNFRITVNRDSQRSIKFDNLWNIFRNIVYHWFWKIKRYVKFLKFSFVANGESTSTKEINPPWWN